MKSLRIATAILALPVAAAAQQPPANAITAAFKARIAASHRNIAQAFDSIPESKFGYKPTPAQLTVGYIAQHVASDSYLFCGAFGATKPTVDARESSTPDSVKATWPKAELVSRLKASFAYCEQAIEQVTDATLPDVISLTVGGAERKVTRINMVLLHALDLADHYSQIANYMRLNGLLPPTALPRPAGAQGDERAIVAVVTTFLDGIRTRDTTLMRSTVAAGALLQPVGGPTGLGAPTPLDAIIERTGKGTGPGNDERIESPKVQIDDPLASVWAYYTLTRPGETRIGTCGVNLFQLRKGSDGWKVFQIAATSKTEGCRAIAR